MVAVSAAQVGSALNDPQDATGRHQSAAVERGAHTNKWAVLVLVAVGTFMTTLDTSIVNISLPSIARTFHTPFGGAVEWVIIAYLVVIAATLLMFGRVSDLIGRKPVWVAGLILFTLGSALCGAAASLPWLVAARAFQPNARALMNAAPRDEQGESSSLLATARVVGQSLSVALAGAIFASFGGTTATRTLAAPAPHGMLEAGELSALQLTLLSSFRAALVARAVFAAIGIGTALVRGHERSPAARIKHENAS